MMEATIDYTDMRTIAALLGIPAVEEEEPDNEED